jgi:hypothetical protein
MIITAIFYVINKVLELVGALISVLYALLPTSPFSILQQSQFNTLISQINYFLPIYEFVAIMELWLIAIAIFYLYSIFARWIKAIQ